MYMLQSEYVHTRVFLLIYLWPDIMRHLKKGDMSHWVSVIYNVAKMNLHAM